jgi:hypothetical protein
MQRIWSADELGECWSLLPEDLALLAGRVDAGKLGFAVQLAFWRQHGRFPDDEADVAPAVIAHLAAQTGLSVEARVGYAWGVAADVGVGWLRRPRADFAAGWPTTCCHASSARPCWMGNYARSRATRPGAYRLGRIMRYAQAAHDDAALQRVAERLDTGGRLIEADAGPQRLRRRAAVPR